MFNTTINVSSSDWKTKYPPELVGEYIIEQWERINNLDTVVEYKPGQVIPMPLIDLDGFLMWCTYKRKR